MLFDVSFAVSLVISFFISSLVSGNVIRREGQFQVSFLRAEKTNDNDNAMNDVNCYFTLFCFKLLSIRSVDLECQCQAVP